MKEPDGTIGGYPAYISPNLPELAVDAQVVATGDWARYVGRNPNPSQFIPIEDFADDPDCPPFILDAINARRPQFTEDWFADAMCEILAALARETFDLDGMLVEVGSWEGKSTIALANAMWPQQIHAVDTWRGSLGEISWDLAKQRDVYKTFTDNIAAATQGNVIPHKMGWRRWFHDVEGPIRFCFIDANHSYPEVRDNIEAALPRMVPGGILCGDDVHHPPIQRAVMDTVGNADVHGTMWIHRVPR